MIVLQVMAIVAVSIAIVAVMRATREVKRTNAALRRQLGIAEPRRWWQR